MERKTHSEAAKMVIKSKSVFEKESKDDGFRVCVMRFVRDYYRYDLWLRDLAPSIRLLNDYKEKKIGWEEYEGRYLEEIKGRKEAIKKLLGLVKEKGVVTLLCAEKEDKFCHRRLLKEYIESLEVKLVFDDDKNYWGHCPHPEHENYNMNIGRAHWMVCDVCKIKWLIGSNLFSSWRYESEETWIANSKHIKDYKNLSGSV
jgi:uncharacterized protein YeaO (DUF488 family)